VLIEYLNFFATAAEQMRRMAVENAQQILEAPGVSVIPQSHDSFLAGLQLYRARLLDCISMQTMRKEGLTEVLTNDGHFEQEGFRTFVSRFLSALSACQCYLSRHAHRL